MSETAIRRGERELVERVLAAYAANDYDAVAQGYAPGSWGVKDFSLVQHQGRWHLFHILAQSGLTCLSPDAECRVGHASTADLVRWTTHDPVVPALPGTWESHHVFAPHVWAWNGRFHMVYTGINRRMYECLGVATSPDLDTWARQPQPLLDPRAIDWADTDPCPDLAERAFTPCRDPHVLVLDGVAHLYFSAVEKGSGLPVIGVVTSADSAAWSPARIAYRGWDASWDSACLLESSCVHRLDSGRFLLTFNTRGQTRYVVGTDPRDFRGLPCADLPTEENYVSLELVARRPGRWLVACFGGKAGLRMSLGTLEWDGERIVGGRRLQSAAELAQFLSS